MSALVHRYRLEARNATTKRSRGGSKSQVRAEESLPWLASSNQDVSNVGAGNSLARS